MLTSTNRTETEPLPGFPAPVRTFGNGTRVWELAAVEAWRASRR